LASRTLAVLLTVSALAELSSLPAYLDSFLYYLNREPFSSSTEHFRHYYLISVGFAVTKIIGFSWMARWLYKGGPDIEQLLLPSEEQENAAQN
jgi:hypothetical protein